MKFLNEHMKEQRFKNLYLLCGEEDYLKRLYKNRMKQAIVGDDDMNYSYYSDKDIPIKEFIDTCETMPFFAERRLVIVEDSGFFKNACDDALVDYVKAIPEYLIIIFVESEVDKRNRMYKAVTQNGYVCEMNKQDDAMLKKWIVRTMGEYEEPKKCDNRTLDYFLQLTNGSMEHILNELHKVFSYTAGRDIITIEDVQAVCTVTTENKIFDMVAAVATKKQNVALDLYYDLLTLKEPPMRILYLLSRQFNMILQVKELLEDGYSAQSIAKKMGVQGFIVTKCQNQAGYFTREKLLEAMEECASYEEAVKTGRMDDKMCVELIIIKYSQK